MVSKSGCYPVDGGLESGPEGKAQCFVSGVSHAAGRPDGLAGGVRQLEVAIYCLKTERRREDCRQWVHRDDLTSVSLRTASVKCPVSLLLVTNKGHLVYIMRRLMNNFFVHHCLILCSTS